MDPALTFRLATVLAVASWLLLLIAPYANVTKVIIHRGLASALLSAIYIVALVLARPTPEGGGFGTLEEVSILFSNPWVLCAGWIHYLAFDLFVGAFIARDARRVGVSRLILTPILLATFWLGPVGLFSYSVVLALRRKGQSASELVA